MSDVLMNGHLLLVEEDPSGVSALGCLLDGHGFPFERVAWASLAGHELQRRSVDVLIASGVPQPQGALSFLRRLRVEPLSIPTLAVLPQYVDDRVLREVSQAADDFVLWPLTRDAELPERLRRLVRPESTDVGDVCRRLMQDVGLTQLVGRDPVFLAAIERIPVLARTDGPSLITGETGTGKELCARAIHHLSRRSSLPFIPVDCATVPDQLFESEMFGHVRGAFTDAREDRRGLIALAERGTILLDEIDSLSLGAQAKLLRFIQERTYRPLGSDRFVKADVNLVASSNQDLASRVHEGRFRADLFFRLNMIRLHVPPLRERRGDVALLSRHFLDALSVQVPGPRKMLTASAISKLTQYDWPGNVRELYGVLHAALMFAPAPQILPRDIVLLSSAGAPAPLSSCFQKARASTIESFERLYVEDMLRKHCGNVTRAAREAQKDRRAFGRLVKKYSINRLRLQH